MVADALDGDPSLLLEWRGCVSREPAAATPARVPAERDGDPWAAGDLPEVGAPRQLPVGSVLKRLGASGLVVDGVDLRDALEPAYTAFAGWVG